MRPLRTRLLAGAAALALICSADGGSALAQIAGSVYPSAIPVTTPPTAFPATIAASGSWLSGVIKSNGFRGISAGVTSTQAGTISIQRYIDAAGTVAVGSAISQAITTSTPATVAVNDGVPFLSFQITITNSSGSTAATITNPAISMVGW